MAQWKGLTMASPYLGHLREGAVSPRRSEWEQRSGLHDICGSFNVLRLLRTWLELQRWHPRAQAHDKSRRGAAPTHEW